MTAGSTFSCNFQIIKPLVYQAALTALPGKRFPSWLVQTAEAGCIRMIIQRSHRESDGKGGRRNQNGNKVTVIYNTVSDFFNGRERSP